MGNLKIQPLSWVSLVMFILVLSMFVSGAMAQTQQASYITVTPTVPSSPLYTTVGRNQTVSFTANWTYGSDAGKLLQDATVTIAVKNSQNTLIEQLAVPTIQGSVAFNYTSKNPAILTFTATKVVTADKKEYTAMPFDSATNTAGLQATPVTVWWDSFHVSLVNSVTSAEGTLKVAVNVTYRLIPEGGLSLPAWATYNNQTFLPKTVENANVTINGVPAVATGEPGVYTASSSSWLPTAYVHVAVSQVGWITANVGFSFDHTANAPLWIWAVIIASVAAISMLMVRLLIAKKTSGTQPAKHPIYPFFGAVLLVVTSVISLYWGVVGLEGFAFGFDWLLLAVLGVFAFAMGLLGVILTLGKRQQAVAVFLVMMPMLTNLVGVKAALDSYLLAVPWVLLFSSLALSIACGFFVCNSDEFFQKKKQSQPTVSPPDSIIPAL